MKSWTIKNHISFDRNSKEIVKILYIIFYSRLKIFPKEIIEYILKLIKIEKCNYYISTISGKGNNIKGDINGSSKDSVINLPMGITYKDNKVYFVDSGNSKIKSIDKNNYTSEYLTDVLLNRNIIFDEPELLNKPHSIFFDNENNSYITEKNRIRTFNNNAFVKSNIGTHLYSNIEYNYLITLKRPEKIIFDKYNNIYISDSGTGSVIKIDSDNNFQYIVTEKFENNCDINIPNFKPKGLALDKNNNLFISDIGNHNIWKVKNNKIEKYAGNNVSGDVNGYREQALFNVPNDICFDNYGNLLVVDTLNCCIKKISELGYVENLFGNYSSNIISFDHTIDGHQDGYKDKARFSYPVSLCVNENNDIFISDYSNHLIRKAHSDCYKF